MQLATMIPRTTRTGGADITSTARVLLTMVMAVHTATTTSSAPPAAVPSLWIVLGHGMPMDLAITILRTTRTGDAGTTR